VGDTDVTLIQGCRGASTIDERFRAIELCMNIAINRIRNSGWSI
jgi:hypothetical protein